MSKKAEKKTTGAFIREMILDGYETVDILDAVRKEYPDSKAGPGDVSWNRGKLRQEGYDVPDQRGKGGAEKPAATTKRSTTKRKTPKKKTATKKPATSKRRTKVAA